MSNQVYANMMEVSCKAAAGKSICAMPDVCMTPPQTPATPPGVPIPYPNTGLASDCTDGSSSVKISDQEVMLKNKSYFKRSSGDEAGCAPMKGVISSTNMGKVYFRAWSMDVTVEGENVVRHLDLTTHNHASEGPNSPPMAHIDAMSKSVVEACGNEIDCGKKACAEQTTENCSEACKAAQKCLLVPKGKDKEVCCKPDNTGDHMIEDHWIWADSGALMPDLEHLGAKLENGRYVKPGGPYEGAPTTCVNRSRYSGLHGVCHGTRGVLEDALIGSPEPFTYAQGKEFALEAHSDACKQMTSDGGSNANCSRKCLEAQLDDFYGPDGSKELHKPDRRQALKDEQRQSALDRVSPSVPAPPF
jgi:hypothetical protein